MNGHDVHSNDVFISKRIGIRWTTIHLGKMTQRKLLKNNLHTSGSITEKPQSIFLFIFSALLINILKIKLLHILCIKSSMIYSYLCLYLQRENFMVSYISLYHHCQNNLFWAIASLRRFWQICLFGRELDQPVFTSSDFATIVFYRARSSAMCPIPNLEDQGSVFISPNDKVAQLCPQALGSLFVAFYDSQY
jgi:hypothetical protein